MRAALYARFSSDNQRYESITGQLRCSEEYCARKGYSIAKIYTDEAKSGTTVAGRDSFNQMIKDSALGLFDVVIFYQIDRTARNEVDYYNSMTTLQRNGCSYEYSAEGIDVSTANGKLTEGVKVAVAAWYSRDLSIKIKRGKLETHLKAKHNGGYPPLGYDVVKQEYVLNEHEAKAVRQIFAMRLDGAGYGAIADWLKQHGYKTRRGGYFAKNSIHDILRNKKYIGMLELNKTAKGNHHKQGDNYMVLEDVLPAIVDKETFWLVQRALDNRKGVKTTAKIDYALSGRIYCACGSSMIGTLVGSKGNKYAYYLCRGKKYKFTDCTALAIRKEIVEDYVKNILVDSICTRQDEIIAQFMATNNRESEESRLNELENLISKTKKKAQRMLDLYDGEDDMIFNQYLSYKNLIATYQEEIYQLKSAEKEKISEESLKKYLEKLKNPALMSEVYLKKFFQAFDVRVVVSDEEISVHSDLRISSLLAALKVVCLRTKPLTLPPVILHKEITFSWA